jgi:transposase
MGGRRYSQGFKDRMVERLTLPGAPTATDLSDEVNISQGTLSRWVREARSLGNMGEKKPPRDPGTPAAEEGAARDARSTREWSPAEKLRVVAMADQLKDAELGALLRREGIHLAQLEQWREEMLTAMGSPLPRRKSPDARRILELERELARKDKALAEVTALLVLRKKLQALFGDSAEEGESVDEDNEKK